MPYTLMQGTFYVVGSSPDGDSIKFRPDNVALWDQVSSISPAYRPEFERNLADTLQKEGIAGVALLRLQGIDALETHYSPKPPAKPEDIQGKPPGKAEPKPGTYQQPTELGRKAADEFLRLLGVQEVEWKKGFGEYITRIKVGGNWTAEHARLTGYIVAQALESHGRPIAWVFPGAAPDQDGAPISKAELARRVKESANYQLLKQGLVYPYFYATLPSILRKELLAAAKEAQRRVRNIWAHDQSGQGVPVSSLAQITRQKEGLQGEVRLLWPYLFRRVLDHWHAANMEAYWQGAYSEANRDKINLDGFLKRTNPYVFIESEKDFLRLDEVLEIKGNVLRLTKPPHDIVSLDL